MHMMRRGILRSFLLLALTSGSVLAKDFAGVSFEESSRVSISPNPFVLSGVARMEKNFISYYAVGLYVPYGAKERGTLISALGPLKFKLIWITPALGEASVQDYWRTAFTQSIANKEALERNHSRIEAFVKRFKELKYGDITELEYNPDMGMKLFINGTHQGNFAGVEFNRALVQIWLGSHDQASAMRASLLAGVK
jgi:Chalcone isomerase-like